ncbi:MAG: ketoacyl-ACP synthase III [Candidatus Phytoplasma sp.]|nr:ketoacyl-ACP synthase III [Phytoplasma sp.]
MNPKIKVVSTGKYIPDEMMTNDDLAQIVDTSHEWIYSRTGIETRYVAKEMTTADLAYLSAKNAIDKLAYDITKIDLIVVATMTNELKNPSIANIVQAKLGLNDQNIMAFDLNAACTGFIYALDVASSLLNSKKFKAALVIGAEKMSEIIDYQDRNTCVLFGDGAGAVIIEKSENIEDQAYFYSDSSGDTNETLYVLNKLKMDGKKVYQFAVDVVPKAITHILNQANTTMENIDMVIPHQANKRIIESVAKHLNLPVTQFFMNINKYGNTSAASIPIALDEYKETQTSSKKVLLVGFGGGFTWGSAIIKI